MDLYKMINYLIMQFIIFNNIQHRGGKYVKHAFSSEKQWIPLRFSPAVCIMSLLWCSTVR